MEVDILVNHHVDTATVSYSLDLPQDQIAQIAPQLRASWTCVTDLVRALKTVSSMVELDNCVHPGEYDRCETLLLSRTDLQWREDRLGGALSATRYD